MLNVIEDFRSRSVKALGAVSVMLLLAACNQETGQAPDQYRLGGTLIGLEGDLTLAVNGSVMDYQRDGDGFTFVDSFVDGSDYEVSIVAAPDNQQCNLDNARGVIDGNVTSIEIHCLSFFSLGGTLSGLTGELLLSVNGAEMQFTQQQLGDVTFEQRLLDGSEYQVEILTDPDGQQCNLSNGSGFIAGESVTSIEINCLTFYAIGGKIAGLNGEVTLSLNGQPQTFNSDDLDELKGFNFDPLVLDGSEYQVSLIAAPESQLCLLDNGGGSVSGSDVFSISINCASSYSLGGSLEGLLDGGEPELALTLNDQETIRPAGNTFGFDDPLFIDARHYDIRISQQPAEQLCQIENGQGEATSFSVSDVRVYCYSWQAPVQVDNPQAVSSISLEAQLAMNNSGEALAVWTSKDFPEADVSSRYQTWVQQYQVEEDWIEQSREQLNPVASEVDYQYVPQVALNNNGNALVTWNSNHHSLNPYEQGDVLASRYTEIDAWQYQGMLDVPPPYGGDLADYAQVALGDDLGVLVWKQNFSGQSRIMARTYHPTEDQWSDAENIEREAVNTDGDASSAYVAINSNNEAMVIWQQRNASGIRVWANLYRSGQWQGAQLLDSSAAKSSLELGGFDGIKAKVSINQQGQAVAIWLLPKLIIGDEGYEWHQTVLAKTYSPKPGEGWIATAQVLGHALAMQSAPDVTLDSQGKVVAVWEQDKALFAAHYDLMDSASVWMQESLLPSNAEYLIWDPKVASDPAGNAVVIWQKTDLAGQDSRIQAKLYSPEGGCWCNATASLLNGPLQQNSVVATPKVAMDEQGRALAIWQLNEAEQYSLWSAAFK